MVVAPIAAETGVVIAAVTVAEVDAGADVADAIAADARKAQM
jgi:hypothetical protein